MDEKQYDCAIAGGGLAGLTLAIQLAQAGHSVILFEKECYPFHKVCGEYISMESYGFLERLGVPLAAIGVPMIDEVKISAPGGNTLLRKLDLGGFGISRYTLDATLAGIAKSKGVVLMEATKVTGLSYSDDYFTIKTQQQSYTARIVCGSFGKRSALARKAPGIPAGRQKNYVGVKYHVRADVPTNRIELHNFKDGYCGISKVDGDKYCLCYLTDAQNLRDSDNDIKKMEEKVLMKNPFLKDYFNEAIFLYQAPLTISQVTFSKKAAVEDHMLLLGDAAGTIAPLCGNGMSMAMRASFIAARLLEGYFAGEISRTQMETRYTRQWNDNFATRIQFGKTIQHLLGKEVMTNVVISALKIMPFVADKLISLSHGSKF